MKIKVSTLLIVLIIAAVVGYVYYQQQQKKDGFTVIPKGAERSSSVPFEYFTPIAQQQHQEENYGDGEQAVTLLA